ncbi:MAG TPA: sigma-70 family RNA polymerase sigma factor [Thermoanaerobaculia bacterium]|jgi:RNA polymerase sigma-70 factor (ECF subfamily)|nr:sigma-70 family RNA polymerase sigma factor [Thermoanaerobaculia bacterium]
MVDADDARISDETLIGRVAAGDSAAFERLVKRHQAAVFRFARAAAPTGSEPEEILRETFLAARRVAARYRHEPSARPWLLTLARQAIDRRHPLREADSTPLHQLARAAAEPENASGEGASVATALASLPAEDRGILTLCDRELFTTDEAARVTGLDNAAVRTRLHRARLRLLATAKENGRGR